MNVLLVSGSDRLGSSELTVFLIKEKKHLYCVLCAATVHSILYSCVKINCYSAGLVAVAAAAAETESQVWRVLLGGYLRTVDVGFGWTEPLEQV